MDPGEKLPYIGLPAMLATVQIIALLLSSLMIRAGVVVFEDPSSTFNIFYFIVPLLFFTATMLVLIHYGLRRLISLIIAISILTAFLYIYGVMAVTLLEDGWLTVVITPVAAVGSTVLLFRYPEWYILDTLGVLIAGGVASIFGISFTQFPVIILLVLLAAYDALSVYRTKHMVSLAESVLDLRTPIMVVIPRKKGYSYLREGVSLGEGRRPAVVMGLGDLIMPTMLTVSAYVFGIHEPAGVAPVLGSALGALAGLGVVMYFVREGRPQAGLPPLNGGAICGFLLGCALVGAWGWLPCM